MSAEAIHQLDIVKAQGSAFMEGLKNAMACVTFLEQENKRLVASEQSLSDAITAKDTLIGDLQAEKANLVASEQSLSKDVSAKNAIIAELQAENAEFQAANDILLALNKRLVDDNKALTSLLKSRSDDYTRTLENCRKRFKTSEPSSAGERDSIPELQDKVRQLQDELDKAKQEVVCLENELETARETNEREIRRLHEQHKNSMKTNLMKQRTKLTKSASTHMHRLNSSLTQEMLSMKDELTKLRKGHNTRSTNVLASNDDTNMTADSEMSSQGKLREQDRKLRSLRHELEICNELLKIASLRARLGNSDEDKRELFSKCTLVYAKEIYHKGDTSWPDHKKRITFALRNVKVRIQQLGVIDDDDRRETLFGYYDSSQVDIWVQVLATLRANQTYTGSLMDDVRQIREHATSAWGSEGNVTGRLHPVVIEALDSCGTSPTRGVAEPAVDW